MTNRPDANKPDAAGTVADPIAQDARIIAEPKGQGMSPKQLHRCIRVLALCRVRGEREIVAMHLYQHLSFERIAGTLQISVQRVEELFESASLRERLALEHTQRANRMRAMMGQKDGVN